MRWTPKRRAESVVAIEKGLIATAEAQRQYGLSEEELTAWVRDYAAHGPPGLRVTRLQQYQGSSARARRLK